MAPADGYWGGSPMTIGVTAWTRSPMNLMDWRAPVVVQYSVVGPQIWHQRTLTAAALGLQDSATRRAAIPRALASGWPGIGRRSSVWGAALDVGFGSRSGSGSGSGGAGSHDARSAPFLFFPWVGAVTITA
ncbi:hypothetical protein VFPBJ_03353 [Purpureocillium lilacinum]|nr:hypothetical protein VFPBJ_03353 [Purpureocillium lilacinum]